MEGNLVAQFDDIIRSMQVLTDPAENKFLEFLEGESDRCKQMHGLEVEVQRLTEKLNEKEKQVRNLDLKLKNARHLLDVEKGRRISAESEKNDLTAQIGLVMELLGRGQVNETRERLQQLQMSFTSSCGGDGGGGRRSLREQQHHLSPGPLSTITEDHDSVDTILNVSQMDITEEDELEDSRLRSGKLIKRKSSPERLDKSAHKRRSGKSSEHEHQSEHPQVKVTCYTSGDAALKKVHTEVEVKTAPLSRTNESVYNETPEKRASIPPMSILSNTPLPSNPTLFSPPSQLGTPMTSLVTGQSYSTPTNTPHTPHTPLLRNYSASKVNNRTHAFYRKTIYRSEFCQPCGNRIKFAKIALKCRDCRATCHQECRESVPLPCVPTATTPSSKGQLGCIADYTPRNSPMIPALVVHCANEVERRGLNEIGMYRVSGSEKDVKELKERFLRGKGMPNLTQGDIHVVSGCLKLFLRSLKEPLINRLLWRDFINASHKSEAQDSAAALYQAISELPQPNRDTLAFMIMHLQRVAECPECKMPTSNLAKVFGPTLVGYSVADPDPSTMVLETRQQQMVMEKLLEISCDYWSTFISVQDENLYTPENAGSLLGGMPAPPSSRRRSFISRTPLQARDHTPKTPYSFRKVIG